MGTDSEVAGDLWVHGAYPEGEPTLQYALTLGIIGPQRQMPHFLNLNAEGSFLKFN
jgi:hypothetical protein